VLTIILPGKPMAWPRAIPTKGGAVKTPAYRGWQAGARAIALHALGSAIRDGSWRHARPFGGPVGLTVDAVYQRPRQRPDAVPPEVWSSRLQCLRIVGSDTDNIAKAAMDLLTGAVYIDDAQVAVLTARTWYAGVGVAPHTVIRVQPVSWTRGEP
jgi:Holliday junction resolvase RusA-like endonuclease